MSAPIIKTVQDLLPIAQAHFYSLFDGDLDRVELEEGIIIGAQNVAGGLFHVYLKSRNFKQMLLVRIDTGDVVSSTRTGG